MKILHSVQKYFTASLVSVKAPNFGLPPNRSSPSEAITITSLNQGILCTVKKLSENEMLTCGENMLTCGENLCEGTRY